MPTDIEFRTNRKKVIEALVFLAERQPRIDVFHVCKVLFYADRDHFRKYGRPILGDNYYAMDDGPVPSFALDIAKRNQFVGKEWLAFASQRLATDSSDGYVRLIARDSFDQSLFSRTDIDCLTQSLNRYGSMPFIELWRLAHKEPAWKAFYVGSGTSTKIPFEALLPEGIKNREKIIEQLGETAALTEI